MDTQVWLPLATLVLGLVLGYVGDLLKDERTSKRERETRRKDRQYEAITEAQDVLGRLVRLKLASTLALEKNFQSTGKWDYGEDSTVGLDDVEVVDSTLRLIALVSRIEDDELKSLLGRCVRQIGEMTSGPDVEASDEARKLAASFVKLYHDRARVVLAELH